MSAINMTIIKTEKNDSYGQLTGATPTTDYDYVLEDSELPDTARGLPTSENQAYGKVPTTRAEDDQNYYVSEEMSGAAKVRMTRNEAYGTSRQSKSDSDTSTENETHMNTEVDDTYDYATVF